jgi:hypothetical protein
MNFKGTKLLVLVWVLSACPTNHDDHNHEEHHELPSDELPSSLVGLKANSDFYQIEIITASPDPAIKGKNDWTVVLRHNNGDAVTDVTLSVVPFMTVHGHGTTPSSFLATASEQEGAYLFEDLNFIMAGTWQLTFTVTENNMTDAGAVSEEIVMSATVAN